MTIFLLFTLWQHGRAGVGGGVLLWLTMSDYDRSVWARPLRTITITFHFHEPRVTFIWLWAKLTWCCGAHWCICNGGRQKILTLTIALLHKTKKKKTPMERDKSSPAWHDMMDLTFISGLSTQLRFNITPEILWLAFMASWRRIKWHVFFYLLVGVGVEGKGGGGHTRPIKLYFYRPMRFLILPDRKQPRDRNTF